MAGKSTNCSYCWALATIAFERVEIVRLALPKAHPSKVPDDLLVLLRLKRSAHPTRVRRLTRICNGYKGALQAPATPPSEPEVGLGWETPLELLYYADSGD